METKSSDEMEIERVLDECKRSAKLEMEKNFSTQLFLN